MTNSTTGPLSFSSALNANYSGGATPIPISDYYRSPGGSLVLDQLAVAANPYGDMFNTSYTPSAAGGSPGQAGNIAYSMTESVTRRTSDDSYYPNSTITRVWKYPFLRLQYPGINLTVNSTNDPVMPYAGMYAPNGNYLGDVGVPFYFCPDTNWPYAGAPSRAAMTISTTNGSSFIQNTYLQTKVYALWLAGGSAATTRSVNQTVPTSGEVKMSNYYGQGNT